MKTYLTVSLPTFAAICFGYLALALVILNTMIPQDPYSRQICSTILAVNSLLLIGFLITFVRTR